MLTCFVQAAREAEEGDDEAAAEEGPHGLVVEASFGAQSGDDAGEARGPLTEGAGALRAVFALPPGEREAADALLNLPACLDVYALGAEGEDARVPVGTLTLDLLPLALGEVAKVGGAACAVVPVQNERGWALASGASLDVSASLEGDWKAASGSVLEVRPVAVEGPVPKGMMQAIEAFSTVISQAAPSFTAAVALPGLAEKAPVLFPQGQLQAAGPDGVGGEATGEIAVAWEVPPSRVFVPAAELPALLDALEVQPAEVEVARYMQEGGDFKETLFETYHGLAQFDLKRLSHPGVSSVTVKAPLAPAGSASRLGPREGEEGKEFENIPENGPPESAWEQVGASLKLEISAHPPLLSAWDKPPKPTLTLEDLISRQRMEKLEEPTGCSEEFRQKCQEIVQGLSEQYQTMFPGTSANGLSEDEASKRKKDLVFDLNTSGKYLQLKDSLRESVVRIVKEKYRRTGHMTHEELQGIYNDVYMYLVDEMHLALAGLFEPKAEATTALPDKARLHDLQNLADEYEVMGLLESAEKCHQERVLVKDNAQLWSDYGSFCMRKGDLGRAEECFRESISLNPDHMDSLLSLACLLMTTGLLPNGDVVHFEHAEVLVQSALEQLEKADHDHSQKGLIWGLLTLVYSLAGDSKAMERRSSEWTAKAVAEEPAEEGEASAPFRYAAVRFLDLKLPELASRALEYHSKVGGEEDKEFFLCKARASMMYSTESRRMDAMDALNSAAALSKRGDVSHLVLNAQLQHKMGHFQAAAERMLEAIDVRPQNCPLEVYLNCGQILLDRSEPAKALDIYTKACAIRPCASTWLGVGRAYYQQGDYDRADLALREANICNNHDARVWGWLAVLAATQGRFEECETAARWAYKEGLQDASILAEIGRILLEKTQYRLAEAALRRSLASGAGSRSRCHLGDVLLEQGGYEEAREQYAAAAAAETSGSVRQHADRGLRIVDQRLAMRPAGPAPPAAAAPA